jgi:hypothetical protein
MSTSDASAPKREPVDVERLRELCSRATPGPWEDSTLPGQKIFAGNMTICDIRGWGYLTGVGGLRLTPEQAIAIQEANAEFIAAARTALPACLDEIEDLRAKLRVSERFAESQRILKETNIQRWTDAQERLALIERRLIEITGNHDGILPNLNIVNAALRGEPKEGL